MRVVYFDILQSDNIQAIKFCGYSNPMVGSTNEKPTKRSKHMKIQQRMA